MFNEYISQFYNNINGLRDFVELIDPLLKEHHNKRMEPHSKLFHPLISSLSKYSNNPTDEIYSQISTEIETAYDGAIKLVEKNDSIVNGLTFSIVKRTDEINAVFGQIDRSNENIELLYKSSLISLLSSVEWFFSQILHFYYDKYPDSASIKKKNLTFEDLKKFNSIRDAESYLVDSKVEEILRGSFNSWIEVLKNDLKLSLGYLNQHLDDLIEIYQRRNLLVHNGGIVNSIYLSNVSDKFKEKYKIKDKVLINENYLNDSICKFELVFILIACELWKNLEPENEERSQLLIEIAYENIKKERWNVGEGLSLFITKDGKMSETAKTISQLNYWQCKKWKGDFKSIENEIKNVDYSDKKNIYRLGYFAINDDINEFIKVLPIVLETKELTIEEFYEYPIFKEMRKTQIVIDFIENNELYRQKRLGN